MIWTVLAWIVGGIATYAFGAAITYGIVKACLADKNGYLSYHYDEQVFFTTTFWPFALIIYPVIFLAQGPRKLGGWIANALIAFRYREKTPKEVTDETL